MAMLYLAVIFFCLCCLSYAAGGYEPIASASSIFCLIFFVLFLVAILLEVFKPRH